MGSSSSLRAGQRLDRTASLATIQRHISSFTRTVEILQERRIRFRALKQHVAAFGNLLDQHPAHRQRRIRVQRDAPERAASFMHEIVEIETGVRAALIELERAYRSLVLAQERAGASQQRLELAQEDYRVGASNFTTLQQIIQSNDQAQRAVIDARFNLLNARVALEERIGGPLVPGN